MKSVKFLFAIIAFATLLVACNKNDDENPPVELDYLIFGHFFGECGGETCVEIYKLEDGKLYEDANDTYPVSSDFYDADFSELSNELFQQVDGLQDVFPDGLLDEVEVVIGQPDAGDWGGLYIEYKKDGVRDFWLLDLAKENVPENYHDFIDAVSEKIDLLSN